MSYKGIYDRTVFYNPVNRYCVISVKTDDARIPEKARSDFKHRDHLIRFTATGFDLPQSDAITLELDGEWTRDDKYGYQLNVERCKEIIPRTAQGVRGYLASGLIKGIGEKTAAAIVERFGIGALDILEHNPERLLEVRGITEEKLEDIKESYAESRVLRDMMTFLAPFQVTPKTAMKIHQFFGADSLRIIRRSPFELCRISGFGFKRVDEIAQKTGCRPGDPMRIMGALFYALDKKCSDEGHLFLNRKTLCRSALLHLNKGAPLPGQRLKTGDVEEQLQNLILRGDLVAYKDFIYPRRSFELEDETACCIAEILARKSEGISISVVLESVTRQFQIRLSKKQKAAVEMAFAHNLSIITGSPGTGKTTVLKTVLEVFRKLNPNVKILLMAPTGRASRRMAESTGFGDARTLHSALGLISGDEEDERMNRDEPIEADLVIVDEFSMADMWLAAQLFLRLKPGTKLLLVGDADQLPSVKPGNVFRELIACGHIPVTVLDEIFRQSKDSLIAYNAKLINENKTSLSYGNDFVFIECENQKEAAEIIQQTFLREVAQSGIEQVQILSPFRTDGEAAAEKVNQAIREIVNPSVPEIPELRAGFKTFRVGDRVMQTKNKGSISNGDVGFIRSFNRQAGEETTVTIEFSDERTVDYDLSNMDSIEFAYAMTVHKAMGSEYDTVILPILAAHIILLYRNLVYTAITRAKRRIFLVGEMDILSMAIRRSRIDKRNTLLGERITLYLRAFTLKAELASKEKSAQQFKLTG